MHQDFIRGQASQLRERGQRDVGMSPGFAPLNQSSLIVWRHCDHALPVSGERYTRVIAAKHALAGSLRLQAAARSLQDRGGAS